MNEEFEQLKAYLLEHKAEFVEHHSMCGDTQGGFYSTDDFDMEKLLEQIDKFGAELRARGGAKT